MTRSFTPSRRAARTAGGLRWAATRWPFVEDEVAGLGELVASGDVCLDIGAEYGLYTFALADLVGPAGHVHSVEPLPGPARWLRAGVAALGCRNVTVHRTALGARAEEHAELSLPRRRGLPVHGRAYLTTGAAGPGPNAEFRTARRVATAVRTVDGLCRGARIEKVHFVKADVEGAEAAVLTGAEDTLLRHRPTLLLELEDRHLAKYGARARELVDRLAGLGYVMHRRVAGRWEPVDEVTEDCRNYLFLN
ncbi:FkbM family methyltransferase [Streptomyces sp. SID3343]|uniref:FkbM family methyltransferase n=1 Tax=Streptomyces sp. SID3343 TaxID=2690260 RepID=UPI00137032AB|nr:FkbM family methyltransferase [Streptomyces sp. SID3343]MYV97200.1 FkbM family methyltransferase [Streptomyces sp. SID3343]